MTRPELSHFTPFQPVQSLEVSDQLDGAAGLMPALKADMTVASSAAARRTRKVMRWREKARVLGCPIVGCVRERKKKRERERENG